MSTRLGVFLFALAWAVLVTPLGIALGRRYKVLDKPGGRKRHKETIPLGGGWTLFSGVLIWSLMTDESAQGIPWVSTGLALVFLVGYLDDMKPMKPFPRLVVHGIAAILGVMGVPELALWQRVLFAIWITGMTSAFNLIDGMNGLALSLSGLTGMVWMLFSRALQWPFLVGSCLGVFFWNFPRARTFLGDSGSTFLGYFCSVFIMLDGAVAFAEMGPLLTCSVMLLLGGIPVFDTCFAMGRRLVCGVSPFCPDRGHFHHRLLDRGWPVSSVLIILSALHVGCLMVAFYLTFTIVGVHVS